MDHAHRTPPTPRLDVLRATDSWAVIEKPSGLLSVPGKGPDKQDCVVARVAQLFPQAAGPIACHRLDMDTSGLIVVGLTPNAHRALSRQFERRTVEKRYAALLTGRVREPGETGEIDLPMRLDVDRRPRQIVDHALGRPARTRFRVTGHESVAGEPATRVAFEPITGRSHQLRVHAAHPEGLGAPIIGDPLYNTLGPPGPRLMLHAERLAFDDPDTGERVDLARPAPF